MKAVARILIAAAVMLLAGGCGKSSSDVELAKRCERAIAKVMLEEEIEAAGENAHLSDGEALIRKSAQVAAKAQCEAEGLTNEQAACFESIEDIESLLRAADCPAIAGAKKPSWFKVSPPEARREALKRMEARKAE